LHVESVAWISERKDVLSGFFFMLTLLCHACSAQKPEAGAGKAGDGIRSPAFRFWYPASILCFACGLMSKPMLVTVPFVLLLLDYWPLQRFNCTTSRRLFVEKIPFFILSAASSVVTYIAQKQGENVQTLAAFPFGVRIENAAMSYATYLVKTFWPADLAVPYPYLNQWPAVEIVMAGMLVVCASMASLLLRRKFPFFFTGWFWFSGMLVPVIGLVQVGRQAMADRYTYLPSIGLFIIIACTAAEISHRRNFSKTAVAVVVAPVFIICAMLTCRQTRYWRSSETLFQHSIAVTRNNAEAYELLGTYYLRTLRALPEALNCFQRSVDIDPSRISARINLGSALLLEGKMDDAAGQFNEVLRLAPANADAWCDLGYISAAHRQFDDAIADYGRAIQIDPVFASAFHDRGIAFEAKNDWADAIQDYRTAIRLAPDDESTHKHLGLALARAGQTREAIGELNQALRLNPDDPDVLQLLQSLPK